MASRKAATTPLISIVRCPGGQRWVAVGRRGHILVSSDTKSWQQARNVPVSTDLVGVYFINKQRGWAVGHGGIILSSNDGGLTWSKQLDGHQASNSLVAHYEHLKEKSPSVSIDTALADAKDFQKNGPGRPFLDIWFADVNHGFAIGAYNLLFGTEDGGALWTPQVDRISNEKGLHLGTIRSIGNDVFIAGEQGFLARLNATDGSFVKVDTPYQGSFFGLTGKSGLLVLFGLQGNAYRSLDSGKTWEKLDVGINGTLTAGTLLDDGRLILANQAGELAISSDNGDHFTVMHLQNPGQIYGLAPGNGNSVVIVGNRGVKTEILK